MNERDSGQAPPVISYVLPCLNEAEHLRATLESLRGQQAADVPIEVLVVDGGSTDDSRAIVSEYARASTPTRSFTLLENPRRYAAAAFNIGVAASRGAVVVLGGARTVYHESHAATVLELLRDPSLSVVGGGVRRFIPARNAPLEWAIASLYASPVGAGAAAYHRRQDAADVDTVYCGAYRREVLAAVGPLDERFTRGQDAEYNSRVRAAGHRIRFDPRLSTEYKFRGGWFDALRRAFSTGEHNARGWKLQPHTLRLRHLAPLAWTAFVLLSPALPWRSLTLLGFALYGATLTFGVLRLLPTIGPLSAALALPVFATFHIAYGLGQLRGLFRRAS